MEEQNMKFLTDEWFDTVAANAYKLLNKSGKMSFRFCEVYENCPGEHPTAWICFTVENNLLKGVEHGYGETPQCDYFAKGKYQDHIKVCKKQLDPKKSVINGTFSVEDRQGGTSPLKLMNLVSMYTKLVEAKQIPGVEY